MSIIKKYNEFLITETLKSYEIDIVYKKLSNMFKKYGLKEKTEWGQEPPFPYFMIVSDKKALKSQILKYENSDKNFQEILNKYKKSDINNIIEKMKKELEEFKYGDIYIFTNYNTPELSKELLNIIESSGYFIATISKDISKDSTDEEWKNRHVTDKSKIEETLLNNKNISISIEPNFDTKVNFDGEYLYHTTNKKNLDKILKNGLIPKTKNTRSFYPERVYLAPNEKYLESIKGQLEIDKPDEYVDLKIKNYKELSLYKDVRFKGGFYTYDTIAPKYIEIINKKGDY